MTFSRTKAATWISASLILCAMIACQVTMNTDGTGTVTIANRTYPIPFGLEGLFKLFAGGAPAQKIIRVENLYSGSPSDRPGTGVISVDVQDVTVGPPGGSKLQPASQSINGSADLDVYIGPDSLDDPCMTGTHVGTFRLTFTEGVVTVDRVSLDLSADVLAEVITGAFSMCLQMTATVDMTVTIGGLDVEFGPAAGEPMDNENANENGVDNENVNENGADNENVNENGTDNENVNENGADNENDNGAADLFTLMVSVTGSGSIDPAGGDYEAGQEVALTATPADGWRFDSWEGDLTGSENPATVTITADTLITAVFVEAVTSTITFRATYDRLWDTDEQFTDYYIDEAVLSGDGEKMMWLIHDADWNRWALTMDFDGGNQTMIALESLEEYYAFGEAAIDQDGSRAFFTRGGRYIYKVESGTVTQIWDRFDWPIVGVDILQTTAAGDYVYFLNDDVNDNDVYRISHSGGAPELVIDDTDVIYSNGFAASQVSDFSVSDDGGLIAFVTHGYWGDSGYVSQNELWVLSGGAYTQLTNTMADYVKTNPRISGDGSIIVFARSGVSWQSIRPDGTGQIELGSTGYNLGGPVLTYDGSKMFYSDSASGGGVLLNTDGSGRLNIFPAWNITNIAIGPTFYHAISDDGSRVSFYTQYGILPESAAFYVGYLDELNVATPSVPDAPYIESISFSPPSMPRGDADATVVLSIPLSDSDGLADITNSAADEMIDGLHESYDYVPAYFSQGYLYDTGEGSDEIAGDGTYTVVARPAVLIDELDSMTIRISVMDSGKTISIADTALTIAAP